MCLRRATYLFVDGCFSELILYIVGLAYDVLLNNHNRLWICSENAAV